MLDKQQERAARALVRYLDGIIKLKTAMRAFNEASPVLKMGNTKLKKGSAVIAGITLAPADKSGVLGASGKPRTVCSFAELAGCKNGCLDDEGRQGSPIKRNLRLARTLRWWHDRAAFLADVERGLEILSEVSAQRPDHVVAFRANVLSDIRWEKHTLPRSGLSPVEFSTQHGLRMYDYTKFPASIRPDMDGYHLTRSYSRHMGDEGAAETLKRGGRVAMIFDLTRKSAPLPTHWVAPDGTSYPVIDGDKNDERWEDPPGVIVGLRLKGSIPTRNGLREIGMVVSPTQHVATAAA